MLAAGGEVKKKKLALGTKRKASENINADCQKRFSLEPRQNPAREKLHSCLYKASSQQDFQWPQSKLKYRVVSSNSADAAVQWTALPRPNTQYLTRQSVGPLGDILAGEPALHTGHPPYSEGASPRTGNSPYSECATPEDDLFTKFDELCASVDLAVFTNPSNEDLYVDAHIPSGHDPQQAHVPPVCPVCGDLLITKALLKEHMKTCIDVILLD